MYNRVLDKVISHLQHRYESIPLIKTVGAFTQLNLADAEDFINYYKDILDIDTHSLNAKATVLRNIL